MKSYPTRKHPISREAINKRPNASEHPWRNAPKPLSPAAQIIKAIKCDGLPLPTPAETDIPRIATIDLEPHHCRFPCVPDVRGLPVEAPIFCGAIRVLGSSYCAAHLARAHSLPQPRRRDLPVVVGKEMAVA